MLLNEIYLLIYSYRLGQAPEGRCFKIDSATTNNFGKLEPAQCEL